MDNLQTYPVLSRVRHSGAVYGPGTERTEISLGAKEALRLKGLGVIGEAGAVAGDGDAEASGQANSTGDLSALSASLADAEKKADDLQSLNEQLVAANEALKAEVVAAVTEIEELKSANAELTKTLDEAVESRDKLADELANADLVIAELKGEGTKADPEPAVSKPAAKTTKKVAGGTAQKG